MIRQNEPLELLEVGGATPYDEQIMSWFRYTWTDTSTYVHQLTEWTDSPTPTVGWSGASGIHPEEHAADLLCFAHGCRAVTISRAICLLCNSCGCLTRGGLDICGGGRPLTIQLLLEKVMKRAKPGCCALLRRRRRLYLVKALPEEKLRAFPLVDITKKVLVKNEKRFMQLESEWSSMAACATVKCDCATSSGG